MTSKCRENPELLWMTPERCASFTNRRLVLASITHCPLLTSSVIACASTEKQNVGRGQRRHAAAQMHALRFLTSTVSCKYCFLCICSHATASSLLASSWKILVAWYKARGTATALLPSYMYPRQCMQWLKIILKGRGCGI